MTTLFIASGDINWASARMRCYWPAAYMQGARVENIRQPIEFRDTDDVVILQKVLDTDLVKRLRGEGRKVFYDLCDPIHWLDPNRVREALPYFSGVVCSNEALRVDFAEWCGDCVPTYTIPDRLELSAFPLRRKHEDVTPVRLIWFGIYANRIALHAAIINLQRLVADGHAIELTIFDELPGETIGELDFPVYYSRWSLPSENEVLAAHDLALLPPYPGAWGAVKSNNKRLTAWASGLAVTDGINYLDLETLVRIYQQRKRNADSGMDYLISVYDARQSAHEWEAILCKS